MGVVLRCGENEHELNPSFRDIHLLDGKYFLRDALLYRGYFGLDFVRGMQPPPLNTVLVTHKRSVFVLKLKGLLAALEDQADLIAYDYQYLFTSENRVSGGGQSGFRVGGLHGSIHTRPSGYCDVVLMAEAPTGRGRIVEIIDMRLKKELETDNMGTLTIRRRKAKPGVGWFETLPKAIAWLEGQNAEEVEVLHRDRGSVTA